MGSFSVGAPFHGPEGEQFNQYTDARYSLGQLLVLPDGRKFRFALNGAAAAVAGKLYQSKAPGANYDELAVAAAAVGATAITVTNGATAITADQFAEGFLNIEDDAGEGRLYKIASNDAEAAGSAAFVVNLYSGAGIQEALTAASTVGLTESPYSGVIIHVSPPTTSLVGVAAADIAAGSYGWFQTYGPCSVLTDGTLVVGKRVMASDNTDGAVEDYVLAEGTPNTLANEQVVGTVREVAATTEYSVIFLTLE